MQLSDYDNCNQKRGLYTGLISIWIDQKRDISLDKQKLVKTWKRYFMGLYDI